ncbi:EF-hand domain-containing protein [Neorhizobium sp. P12A]|uniref:EF-hand domain-containing protein n=1 Tax=Neorhizobium sp. P12A TaxID=2268027 RepID=UPI0011EDAA0F|nr:EF-hand domain-containing protein [Neorhizobium sp. P12A]KAA0685360.1 EF-hand domain-containing protein [Neorhizobium sp. P12A]
MRRTIAILGSLLLASCSAMASDRERARDMFRELDTNGDRKLEFSEIEAARARLFDRLDVNRNGVLDPQEIQAAVESAKSAKGAGAGMQLADLQQRKAMMDRNGDGKISRDEFASFIPDRLIKADADGDQALSLEELRSLRR